MPSPTIDEVKKRKIKLESDILDLITEFEEDNGVAISYLSLNRDYGHERDMVEPMPDRKPGKLKNVDASMELDLIM